MMVVLSSPHTRGEETASAHHFDATWVSNTQARQS